MAGKAYALFGDPADEMSGMVVRAETAGKAKALYEFGFTTDFTQVRAQRVPWLDDYDDPHEPDALMCMLRHGWWVSGVEDPDNELPDEHLTGQDIEKYAKRHRIDLESAYEHVAKLLGATYPDRCLLERPALEVGDKTMQIPKLKHESKETRTVSENRTPQDANGESRRA